MGFLFYSLRIMFRIFFNFHQRDHLALHLSNFTTATVALVAHFQKILHHLCVSFCVCTILTLLLLHQICSLLCEHALLHDSAVCLLQNCKFKLIYKSIDIRLYLPWLAPSGVVSSEFSPKSFLCIVTTALIAYFRSVVFLYTHLRNLLNLNFSSIFHSIHSLTSTRETFVFTIWSN